MSHVVNNTTANNMRAAGGLRGDISNEFEGLSERLPLSTKFDTARDEGAYEKVRTRLEREGRTAEGQPSLADQVRGLQMGTLDVKDVSNANALGAAGQHILLKEKLKADRERATSDALFYALLDQLRDMEEAIISKYGENFAEDMLSDLQERGFIDKERYQEIMKIEDPHERRDMIAHFIQEKIDSGEMSLDDLKEYEWAQDWLDAHDQLVDEIEAQARYYIELGQLPDNVPDDVIEHIKKIFSEDDDRDFNNYFGISHNQIGTTDLNSQLTASKSNLF